MTSMKPVTQKAQGIDAIRDGCPSIGLSGPGHPLMVIPGDFYDCGTQDITWPMFARPCPFRPRHGFVDSISVSSWEEVINLLQMTKSAEPNDPVEIVLAPLLSGKVSAVATNAGVTWGRGNDGVTAGSDPQARFIPVKTSKAAWQEVIAIVVYSDMGFLVPEIPYLELVEDDSSICLVQVRDGPEQPEGVNHVVRKMKVQRVLKADPAYSLLEWESIVHEMAKFKGTVIWARYMSLASHFCVHGIESDIPVITDHEVKVGDVIQPTKNRTSILRKRDYAKVAALITETLESDLKLRALMPQRDALLTAIATTQAQFCWGKEPHLLRLRGLSVAVLLKAVLASCAGEIRHWDSPEGPRNGEPSLYDVLNGMDENRHHRNLIYRRVFSGKFSLFKMERVLSAAETDLGNPHWNRSFGGPRWAEVARTGVELVQATRSFYAKPCAAKWSKVVQKGNRLINTSHNNGKCLTKWIDNSALDMVSLSPTAGFLNIYAAHAALEMTDEGEKT